MTTFTILPCVSCREYVLPTPYIFKIYVIKMFWLLGNKDTSMTLEGYEVGLLFGFSAEANGKGKEAGIWAEVTDLYCHETIRLLLPQVQGAGCLALRELPGMPLGAPAWVMALKEQWKQLNPDHNVVPGAQCLQE